MELSGCSFSELSYSTLLSTYLTEYDKLNAFYEYAPLNEDGVNARAQDTQAGEYKDDYLKSLKDFHEMLGIEEEQSVPREKLAKENALSVVTGQQLGVYGGPMYTVYKTLTAILLARSYENKLGRPVVPVFWLADEDHDFEEIAWAGIQGRDDFHKVVLEQEGGKIPVSEEIVEDSISAFKAAVQEELFETDFSEALWEQLERHYKPGNTHAQAFAGLIQEWFKDEGLLIAGSNTPGIKKLLSEEFSYSIGNAEELHKAIEEKSSELEASFHRQVQNGDTNLFYLSEEEGRVKIGYNESAEKLQAGSHHWTKEELIADIKKQPEKYSPNVFLRPVIQDKLLPTLGYVAGPGELAYYGQMKDLYKIFDLKMPVIFPRFCATIIESGISRIIEKLPFEIPKYEERIEDLESAYVEHAETVDVEAIFNKWKEDLDKAAEEPLKAINEIDPTLDGTVGKTVAGFGNELNSLKGKVYRSIKKQEQIQLNRIEKIKINLFPDGGLQERSVSPINFMNKYGLDLWSKLIAKIEEEGLDLSRHHYIEL